jgi:hypothetical protein
MSAELQKMRDLVDSIRARVTKMLEHEPVMTCPLCENKTFLTEHVPSSDFLEWVEYYVSCSQWDSKGRGCPFNYQLFGKDLADRASLKELFGDGFLADSRIEEHQKERNS